MSRDWTERHIRELIEDELKDIKPKGYELVRSNYKFNVPHYNVGNMMDYMMINHLVITNYGGNIVGSALFSSPDPIDYSTYPIYSKHGSRILGIMCGGIGSSNPNYKLPEYVYRNPDDDDGIFQILTPYIYSGNVPTLNLYQPSYVLMKSALGDKKFGTTVYSDNVELKYNDNTSSGWFTRMNYIVPYDRDGYSPWSEYDWSYRDPDAGTDPLKPNFMQGINNEYSTHTIHFIYHYVEVTIPRYDNDIWR